ncbi:NUDIX hydrolase [Couchioplanes caeruleus]|uniref:NUDIX hydrolase n=2 Tax=Couchioplanes caeruleus TaxID=56438 RepID=A0A1K0FYQ2_9ACTN|nr:NUDIX hydrolase [Couchioplanes caeruleus]OJF10178.1 NUDIX hydrolase [Couchioplanes caeruleus subsp. caeruleus]ROP32443.1 8-oxo-dGTP diphosphatase [Couchioplanes caeruleus]
MTETVRAAGGVLWRPADDGIEICVVHRPYLRDWSLPKGKLDGSEHALAAAVREVLEETGVRGEPQLRLPGVAYTMPGGVPKTVDFWLLRAGDGPAVDPQDPTEVDAVVWLPPREAIARLSYPDDRRLVEHVVTLPPVTGLTLLIRHAHAGRRKDFAGDDALRPVDDRGRAEAETMAAAAAVFAPQRLIAATPLRCRQTLEPLATRLGLPIATESTFAEPGDPAELPARVKAAAARLVELRDGRRTAICSQGKVIPSLLALLDGADDPAPYKTPKGDGWVLTWSGDRLVALSRI